MEYQQKQKKVSYVYIAVSNTFLWYTIVIALLVELHPPSPSDETSQVVIVIIS